MGLRAGEESLDRLFAGHRPPQVVAFGVTLLRFALSLLMALSLGSLPSGCAVSRDAIKDKLETSTQAYARATRWGDWDAAANYVPEESAPEYARRGESLREDVTVVDRELLSLKYQPEKASATVRYSLSWQRDREIVVRDTVLEEGWVFFAGKWYLVAHKRLSGEPLELMGEAKTPNPDKRFSDPLLPGRQAFIQARKKEQDKAKNQKKPRKRKALAR